MRSPDDDIPTPLNPPWHHSLSAVVWMMTSAVMLMISLQIRVHHEWWLFNPLILGAIVGVGMLSGYSWSQKANRLLTLFLMGLCLAVFTCIVVAGFTEICALFWFEDQWELLLVSVAGFLASLGLRWSATRPTTGAFYERAAQTRD